MELVSLAWPDRFFSFYIRAGKILYYIERKIIYILYIIY